MLGTETPEPFRCQGFDVDVGECDPYQAGTQGGDCPSVGNGDRGEYFGEQIGVFGHRPGHGRGDQVACLEVVGVLGDARHRFEDTDDVVLVVGIECGDEVVDCRRQLPAHRQYGGHRPFHLHRLSRSVVGHSFGGGPTVEAALAAGDRVRALVLVDAALGIRADDATAPLPAIVRGALAVAPLRTALVAAFLTNPAFTRRLLAGFVADPAVATDARVAVYQRPLTVWGTTAAVATWLPELVAPPIPSRSESPAAYRTLAMPVVAIWGARDDVTPLAQGEALVRLVPRGRLEVMPAVGHIPQIEDADGFATLLVRVLREVGRDAAS